VIRRNRAFATFIPGTAQLLEGRTLTGVIGMFVFLLFVTVAVFIGRLAPAIGPVAESAHLLVRALAIALAVVTWLALSLPVYRRRVAICLPATAPAARLARASRPRSR